MTDIIVKVLPDGRRINSEGKILPRTKGKTYIQLSIFDFLEEKENKKENK